MSRLRSRIERQLQAQAQREAVDLALAGARVKATAPITARSAPADRRRLRLIPAIGRGVSGGIPGTRPGDRIR